MFLVSSTMFGESAWSGLEGFIGIMHSSAEIMPTSGPLLLNPQSHVFKPRKRTAADTLGLRYDAILR